MTIPASLLTTKLYLPPARPNRVPRRRLLARLDQDRRLTLIAAPAGYGKTTLLSDWIPHSPHCVTWVSLDEGDNDPSVFWAYCVAAFQRLHPDLGQGALALLQTPQPPPTSMVLTALLNDLAAFPDGFALVLDDYHVITTPPVHEGLTYLLEHMPSQGRLIVTSRIDPLGLPLARLRARDQLNELRADDLRFTADEASAFLNEAMGLKLSAGEVSALEVRTEGWIAGLQLAALSMRGRDDTAGFIRAFSGSHRHVLSYLIEEVLNRRPEGTLNFLLQTSILDRLCGSLCDAVTGQTGGQATLERLEQANLFLVPLDNDGQWYRYHHLFAEVLRNRLKQTQPELISQLNGRASAWHEQSGFLAEAVNYALAAQDFERAARLIEVIGLNQFAQQTIQLSLQTWLAALPDSVMRTRPRLYLIDAYQLFFRLEWAEARERVAMAEAILQSAAGQPHAATTADWGAVAAMRAFVGSYTRSADSEQVIGWGRTALAQLGPNESAFRGLAMGALAFGYLKLGDLLQAEQAYGEVAIFGRAAGDVHVAVAGLSNQLALLRARGQLQPAEALCEAALDWLAERGALGLPSHGYLCLSKAELLYERGHSQAARRYAQDGLLYISRGPNLFQLVTGRLTLLRITMAHRDWDDALTQLNALLDQVREQISSWRPSLFAALRAQIHLRQGEQAEAWRWAQTAAWEEAPVSSVSGISSFDVVWHCQHERLTRTQIYIAQANKTGNRALAQEALSYLVRQAQMADEAGLLWLRVKAFVLQTLAWAVLGDPPHALASLHQALALAEPAGLVNVFAEEGEPLRAELAGWRAVQAGQAPAALVAYADRVLAAFGAGATQPIVNAVTPAHAQRLVELLSERELEVLRLVADGLNNQEIAERLVVAHSTVKKHINSIFGKLNAGHRAQAVARARELQLL